MAFMLSVLYLIDNKFMNIVGKKHDIINTYLIFGLLCLLNFQVDFVICCDIYIKMY